MKITHYLCNAFIIETGDKKITIDPAGLMFYFFRFSTLIPRSEWETITHIFITQGHPGHYGHANRVAEVSKAPIICCNKALIKDADGKRLMSSPQEMRVTSTTEAKKVYTLSVDETIHLDGMSITGIKTAHEPFTVKSGSFSGTAAAHPEENVNCRSLGFLIEVDGKTIVNLGDALLHREERAFLSNPDVLMIPIGAGEIYNTTDEREALAVIKSMRPELVIPYHYGCPAYCRKKLSPSSDNQFKKDVEDMGIQCAILQKGESLVYEPTAVAN